MMSLRPRQARSSGFTMTEMVIASAILALLLASTMSVTILTRNARSTEDSDDAPTRSAEARRVMEQIATDIKSATQITSRSASSITMVVPDRNGDGSPEWMTYTLSGSTLYLNYNSILPVTLLSDVTGFRLGYTTATAAAPQAVESAEQLLFSYTGARDGVCDLNASNWESQYFQPTLSGSALSWKITRAEVLIRKKTALSNGTVTLQVRGADAAFKPTSTVLATSTLNASSLATTDAWTNFVFSTPVADLAPGTGMTIVALSSAPLVFNVDIGFRYTVSPALTNARECFTSNAGTSWSTPTVGTESMIIRVYGTVTTLQ
jgi:prepilin-type N-terminal cleavage/methylation domain-containing protein